MYAKELFANCCLFTERKPAVAVEFAAIATKGLGSNVHRRNAVADIIHTKCEETHEVIVDALHVLIVPDNAQWFARSIEIDYSASGSSVDDVKERFERGFALTVKAHLRKFGNLSKLLNWAPIDVINEYDQSKHKARITTVMFCEFMDEVLPVPFKNVQFFSPPELRAV